MIRTRRLGYYHYESSEWVGEVTGGDNWQGIVAPFFTRNHFFQKVNEHFFVFSKKEKVLMILPFSLTYKGSTYYVITTLLELLCKFAMHYCLLRLPRKGLACFYQDLISSLGSVSNNNCCLSNLELLVNQTSTSSGIEGVKVPANKPGIQRERGTANPTETSKRHTGSMSLPCWPPVDP